METKKSNKLLWILLPIILIVIIAAAGVYYFYFYKKSAPVTTKNTTNTSKDTTKTTVSPITDPGVTWVEPEKLSDLGLILLTDKDYKNPTGIGEIKGYYKVADLTSGGEIILGLTLSDSMGISTDISRFRKDSSGTYFYLQNHSFTKDYAVTSKFLSKDVEYDATTKYQSLSSPDFLTFKDTTLKSAGGSGLFSELVGPESIGKTEYGSLYQTPVNPDLKEVGGVSFHQKLSDSTYTTYIIQAKFFTDDEVALVTWKDGTKNTGKYTSEGYAKCGVVATNNIILNIDEISKRLIESGKTNAGDTIYTVSSTDAIMKSAYDNYIIGRTKDILSISEFASKNPIFIWKSPLEDYVVVTGRDFAGLAECGKPVIYLYPEKTQAVSVKVGATITKSEPEYLGGWQVIANPSGLLNLNGKTYDSLYWEGKGQIYPEIKEGTVVKRTEIESVIRGQLGELGLNTKETNDFVDFWLPKMPNTPYIRLTWFGTKQMDKLAPLSVSPSPDTIIRVFLDFEGLNTPISIQPQKLSTIPRKGFTVIEWGGLLRE